MSNKRDSAAEANATAQSAPVRALSPARTPETEDAYIARAASFVAHAARHLDIGQPGPMEVAAYAVELREEWAKSTWRQMKASLIYFYSVSKDPAGLKAIEFLRGASQSCCAVRTGRTSARRAKTITKKKFSEVIGAIRRSRSQYSALLESWFVLGCILGLRPHEWTRAEIIWASPLAVGDLARVEAASVQTASLQPYLRVRNAKATNGRSHGESRHLNLQKLLPSTIDAIEEFASEMRRLEKAGLYGRCYRGAQKLLQRINKELHPKKQSKWVQLYSARHRFSSDAKKTMDRESVAALMGHATTKTASEHYGRRSVRTGGALGPRPIASEVIRVRKARQRRSVARGVPTAPIAAVSAPRERAPSLHAPASRRAMR